jgi:hypothetical protein
MFSIRGSRVSRGPQRRADPCTRIEGLDTGCVSDSALIGGQYHFRDWVQMSPHGRRGCGCCHHHCLSGPSCRSCLWPEPRAHSCPGPTPAASGQAPGPTAAALAMPHSTHSAGAGHDSGARRGRCGCHSTAPCRSCQPGPRYPRPHSRCWWPAPGPTAAGTGQDSGAAAATVATAPHTALPPLLLARPHGPQLQLGPQATGQAPAGAG